MRIACAHEYWTETLIIRKSDFDHMKQGYFSVSFIHRYFIVLCLKNEHMWEKDLYFETRLGKDSRNRKSMSRIIYERKCHKIHQRKNSKFWRLKNIIWYHSTLKKIIIHPFLRSPFYFAQLSLIWTRCMTKRIVFSRYCDNLIIAWPDMGVFYKVKNIDFVRIFSESKQK